MPLIATPEYIFRVPVDLSPLLFPTTIAEIERETLSLLVIVSLFSFSDFVLLPKDNVTFFSMCI